MSWTEEEIQEVWEKGNIVTGVDPNEWRKDKCDAWIYRKQHGNCDSIYGWEIDHITSTDHGGKDIPSNFRPLQWENNRSKSSDRLKCVVTSDGNRNIDII